MIDYQCYSDEMLLASYLLGNEQAFANLVTRYEQLLFHYTYQMLGDYETARDIVQETFVRVITHAWRFSPEKIFRPWIYTITSNLLKNELRKKKRKIAEYLMENNRLPIETKKTPVDKLIAKETEEELHYFIDCLPNLQKMVFILRFYQKMPYEQISVIVGCKTATARSRMFYCIEKLKKFLED